MVNRSLAWSYPSHHLQCSGARIKEKKDPVVLEAFFSLAFLPLSLYNLLFPFIYKRGSRTPHEGHGGIRLNMAQYALAAHAHIKDLGSFLSLARL